MSEKQSRNIYQRLLAAMEEVSYVQKEDKKVNNQYTFVSHDAVVAKVRPALMKQGIAFTTDVRDFKVNGNRCELVLECSFVNAEDPLDRIVTSAIGFGIDSQDKGPGKAMSYAKKYALLQAMLLATGDDPERDIIDHKPAKSKAAVARAKAKAGGTPETWDNNLSKDEKAKAAAYLRTIGWTTEGQSMDIITNEQRGQILANWAGFCQNAGI